MAEKESYTKITAQDNNAYVCPLELVRTYRILNEDQLEDCVEADVVGRYSGNLRMVEK